MFSLLCFFACQTQTKMLIEPSNDVVIVDDVDGDGFDANEDCDDSSALINPAATEICDGQDNNCNDEIDEGVLSEFFLDEDGDGFGDPNQGTEACEAPDGTVPNANDCDDSNANAYPSNNEICDEVDNDCDGEIDEDVGETWFPDTDQDGFGNDNQAFLACEQPENAVQMDGDCDDSNPDVNPDAYEICDELDNNCNDLIDDNPTDVVVYFTDADNDGYGDPNLANAVCELPAGAVLNNTDCDDSNSAVFPSAPEVCDGVDNDCDLLADEADSDLLDASTWYLDRDADGYGDDSTTATACQAPQSYVALGGDCDDFSLITSPGASESCDGIDNNCDGSIDEGVMSTFYADQDGDGFGDPATLIDACAVSNGLSANSDDCDDTQATVHLGATELCDELDNDCDGSTDENVLLSWYLDRDSDGYGDLQTSSQGCAPPTPSYVGQAGDCDDLEPLINPGAAEGCAGMDENCDGLIDNDADGDNYSADSCGGADCDDNDPGIYPDATGLCVQGSSCAELLSNGLTIDGAYGIDVDGINTGQASELLWCDLNIYGGGWTLVGRNTEQDGNWNPYSVVNNTTFGDLATTEYKTDAYSVLPFTDVMFTDGVLYAVYENVGDGSQSFLDFSNAIPNPNCGSSSGYNWPMTAGNFTGSGLCNTNLYMHPIDEDGGYNSSCDPYLAGWTNNASGPTWSVGQNNGCPLDDVNVTSFTYNGSVLPWLKTGLELYIR